MWEVLAQLCFDPQNEQQVKNKENESSLRWIAIKWSAVGLFAVLSNKKISEGERNYEKL